MRIILLVFLSALVVTFSVLGIIISIDSFDPHPQMSNPSRNSLYLDPTQPIEARVADLLSYMTLEEKIGQMALVERKSLIQENDISKYHLGALLSGAGSKPEDNTAEGWVKMISSFQLEAKQSRLRIPLLYGVDAIHGHAHVPGATVFPHSIGLGATHDPELVKKVAEATAKEIAVTGANWSFSPNLDQPKDIRWGRVYEAFSDDPVLVSMLGTAYIEGLQTPSEKKSGAFVLATPKHYLGLGSMGWNTSVNKNFRIDQGVTEPSEALLRSDYLPPFRDAIDAGALSVMVGLNVWGDKEMVRQKYLLTDVLKHELKFKGFVVSDWYGVYEGRRNIFGATVSAVNAGVDMVMLPFDYVTFTRNMKWASRLGFISDERIDEAVGRILYAKFASGLFDNTGVVSTPTDISLNSHRALAREAVAQSLVLLKNDDSLLPIKNDVRHIRVAGSTADNIGRQMGAWSIEWQGIGGNEVAGATSILKGIQEEVGLGTNVEYDQLGNFSNDGKKAEIGIAIVGEKPYAEGWGDKEYPILDTDDLQAIENLRATCEKIIVVIVSGRPLLIEREVDSFDVLVAAWLPGSEGAGVSDVLFGHKQFTGTLPLPWPARSQQLPITSSGDTHDGSELLFERGFGLKD